MELGFVGLGRMGGNMVTRLAREGHRIVAWDPSADATKRARDNGAAVVGSLGERGGAVPAAMVRPTDGRLLWILDRAAAALLPAGRTS